MSAVRDGGEWHYSIGMWRQLLEGTNAAKSLALILPEGAGTGDSGQAAGGP